MISNNTSINNQGFASITQHSLGSHANANDSSLPSNNTGVLSQQ